MDAKGEGGLSFPDGVLCIYKRLDRRPQRRSSNGVTSRSGDEDTRASRNGEEHRSSSASAHIWAPETQTVCAEGAPKLGRVESLRCASDGWSGAVRAAGPQSCGRGQMSVSAHSRTTHHLRVHRCAVMHSNASRKTSGSREHWGHQTSLHSSRGRRCPTCVILLRK